MTGLVAGIELLLIAALAAFVVATITADKGYPFGAGLVLGIGLPLLSLAVAVALPRRDDLPD